MCNHPLQLGFVFYGLPGPFEFSLVAIIAYYLFAHRLPEILRLFERLPQDAVERERYLRRVRNWHQLHPPTARDYINEILPAVLIFALLFVVMCFKLSH